MALNEGVNWDQAGDTVTDSKTGSRVKDAFKNGKAEKVLLKAGTQLYKFNAYPTLGRGNEEAAKSANPRSAEASEYYSQVLSPWWSPYQPFKHDAGWQAKKQLASHLNVSVRELGRNTSAIKENWNSLQYLLVINLKQPTYAFSAASPKCREKTSVPNPRWSQRGQKVWRISCPRKKAAQPICQAVQPNSISPIFVQPTFKTGGQNLCSTHSKIFLNDSATRET